jgi:hypothetical protein
MTAPAAPYSHQMPYVFMGHSRTHPQKRTTIEALFIGNSKMFRKELKNVPPFKIK